MESNRTIVMYIMYLQRLKPRGCFGCLDFPSLRPLTVFHSITIGQHFLYIFKRTTIFTVQFRGYCGGRYNMQPKEKDD